MGGGRVKKSPEIGQRSLWTNSYLYNFDKVRSADVFNNDEILSKKLFLLKKNQETTIRNNELFHKNCLNIGKDSFNG